jgi:hypothetical protein
MDHMPENLIDTLYDWIRRECAAERKPQQTEVQFLLACRKKSWGPNKEMIWRMDEEARRKSGESLEAKFAFLFEQLNVTDTQQLVEKLVPEPEVTFEYP